VKIGLAKKRSPKTSTILRGGPHQGIDGNSYGCSACGLNISEYGRGHPFSGNKSAMA
jgi:hypothetical protein